MPRGPRVDKFGKRTDNANRHWRRSRRRKTDPVYREKLRVLKWGQRQRRINELWECDASRVRAAGYRQVGQGFVFDELPKFPESILNRFEMARGVYRACPCSCCGADFGFWTPSDRP